MNSRLPIIDVRTPLPEVASAIPSDPGLAAAWSLLLEKLPKVRRAFQKVRKELAEIGLLAGGEYLGQVELYVNGRLNTADAGFVFDEGVGPLEKKVGFKPGTIYLPLNLPHCRYVPGYTLADTIRHEFAHAWHWLEPSFFRRPWFRETFGAAYTNFDPMPLQAWTKQIKNDISFARKLRRCENSEQVESIKRKHLLHDFVTEYASTMSREDFAETFMYYLKYRHSLDRFQSRTGAYQKLIAVEDAIATARRELKL
jgi:hypothetical protein